MGRLPGKLRGERMGKGTGCVHSLSPGACSGSVLLMSWLAGGEATGALAEAEGLVGVQLGFLHPRGTSFLPLMTGAEGECLGLFACRCDTRLMVCC